MIITIATHYLLSLCIEEVSEDMQHLVNKLFTDKTNYFLAFITLCIFTPMVETIISHNIMVRLTRRYVSKKVIWQILLPGLFFGLAHFHNLTYILTGIVVGIFFASCFVLYEKHRDTNLATLAVAIIHAIINSVPFFRSLYLNVLS